MIVLGRLCNTITRDPTDSHCYITAKLSAVPHQQRSLPSPSRTYSTACMKSFEVYRMQSDRPVVMRGVILHRRIGPVHGRRLLTYAWFPYSRNVRTVRT